MDENEELKDVIRQLLSRADAMREVVVFEVEKSGCWFCGTLPTKAYFEDAHTFRPVTYPHAEDCPIARGRRLIAPQGTDR